MPDPQPHLNFTVKDASGRTVASHPLPVPTQHGPHPNLDALKGKLPTVLHTQVSAPSYSISDVDDSFIINLGGEQLTKVTGPPFGPGYENGTVTPTGAAGPGPATGVEYSLTFELWNSTGGPTSVRLELGGVEPAYVAVVEGWTPPIFWGPITPPWGVKIVRRPPGAR